MIKILKIGIVLFLFIFINSGCGSFESGIIDTGFFNTGGTDDPRRLIMVAHNRFYKSNRILGARNVLHRAIEQSKKKNDYYALTMSYNMMAYTYIAEPKSNNYTEKIEPVIAESYYHKAEAVAKEHKYDCELVHTYVGFALINKSNGFLEKACEYKVNGEKIIKSIRTRMEKNIKVCETGEPAIKSAENRLLDLHSYLKCNQ